MEDCVQEDKARDGTLHRRAGQLDQVGQKTLNLLSLSLSLLGFKHRKYLFSITLSGFHVLNTDSRRTLAPSVNG